MIVNILDCRADHRAIGPIDAAIVRARHMTDERGIMLVEPDFEGGRLKTDVLITAAVDWARRQEHGVILMLFDAESNRTALADDRVARKDALVQALQELSIEIPFGGLHFEEELESPGKAIDLFPDECDL